MRMLILGGTGFLGRHLVEAASARGHRIVLFNRGITAPRLFPELETLRGDRRGPLSPLEHRTWDAVVDTCGYYPWEVDRCVRALAAKVGHYLFVSSIAVYADFGKHRITENEPTIEPVSGIGGFCGEVTLDNYGSLKSECERSLSSLLPERALTIRPGVIVGPWDPLDRLGYWVRKAREPEGAAPGRPERAIQLIDVRDLALWMVRMLEAGQTGVFNASGPGEPLTMNRILEACARRHAQRTRWTWVADSILVANGIRRLPLWMPEDKNNAGFFNVDSSKAVQEGLAFRPFAETVDAVARWAEGCQVPTPFGLTPDQERSLIATTARNVG